MTEESQKILDKLRSAAFYRGPEFSICDKAADEIERLAEELQYQYACDKAQQQEIERLSAGNKELSRSGPADYIPPGGAGNGA